MLKLVWKKAAVHGMILILRKVVMYLVATVSVTRSAAMRRIAAQMSIKQEPAPLELVSLYQLILCTLGLGMCLLLTLY